MSSHCPPSNIPVQVAIAECVGCPIIISALGTDQLQLAQGQLHYSSNNGNFYYKSPGGQTRRLSTSEDIRQLSARVLSTEQIRALISSLVTPAYIMAGINCTELSAECGYLTGVSLVAGANIVITINPNGSITIASPTGGVGPAGAPGSVLRTGAGVPSNALGINGDYYLNTANGDLYFKAAGVYTVVDNLTGPAGAPGGAGASALEAISATTTFISGTPGATVTLHYYSIGVPGWNSRGTAVIPVHGLLDITTFTPGGVAGDPLRGSVDGGVTWAYLGYQ